jgi:hypothetical protein
MDMSTLDEGEPVPPRTGRKGRRLHVLRTVLLAVFGTIALAWLILFVTKGRFLKHPAERIVGSLIGRTVAVKGDFQLSS